MRKLLAIVLAAGFLFVSGLPAYAGDTGKTPVPKGVFADLFYEPFSGVRTSARVEGGKKSKSNHPFPEKKQKRLYQTQIGKWGGP